MKTNEVSREAKMKTAAEVERRANAALFVVGRTYPVRDTLKANGCLWDKNRKCWVAPDQATMERMQAVVDGGTSNEQPPTPPPLPPPEEDADDDTELPDDDDGEEEGDGKHPFQDEANAMAKDIGYETAAGGVQVQVPIEQLIELFCRAASALYLGDVDVQELLDNVIDGCERGKADKEAADEAADQVEAMPEEEAEEVIEERVEVVDKAFDIFDAGELNTDSLDL